MTSMPVVHSTDPRVPCEVCGDRTYTRMALIVKPTGHPARLCLCVSCRLRMGGPKS